MNGELEHYSRLWGLRSLGKLTEDRPTSRIYKVEHEGAPAVLKLLTDLGTEDEHHGATALECWAGRADGRLHQADEAAHLLEFVDGHDCVSFVHDGHDGHDGHDEQASGVIGDTLAILHGAHEGPPPASLTSLDDGFRELFDARERPGIDPIFSRAAETARELLANPLDEAVPHGNLHHENVLHSSERGWLAIDAKGLRGETTYDGVTAVLNPRGSTSSSRRPSGCAASSPPWPGRWASATTAS